MSKIGDQILIIGQVCGETDYMSFSMHFALIVSLLSAETWDLILKNLTLFRHSHARNCCGS